MDRHNAFDRAHRPVRVCSDQFRLCCRWDDVKRHAIAIAAALGRCSVSNPNGLNKDGSANFITVGCRDGISGEPFLRGLCAGMVATIFYFSHTHFAFCPPNGSNVGQATRVVVLYIDQRPARIHEDFMALQ